MQRDCFSIHDDDIANRIIVKNDLVFAFPSNRPIRPGHILVCPIRHVSTISGLYENELLAICALAENIKHALQKSV
jgi:diadenosine tetraphosphate (Ap4A) HIT family hydrolase